MKKILGLVAALVAMSVVAVAGGDIAPVVKEVKVKPSFYVGGGVTLDQSYVDGEKAFFDNDEYSSFEQGLAIIGGYRFYNTCDVSVSVEGRAARTFWNDDDGYIYNYGVYLKPEVFFKENLGVYALAGYSQVSVHHGAEENGFAYGVGAEYALKDFGGYFKDVSVFMEYVMQPSFDTALIGQSVNNDTIVFGAVYTF